MLAVIAVAFHHYTLALETKRSVWLKNVLDEVVQIIHLIKY